MEDVLFSSAAFGSSGSQGTYCFQYVEILFISKSLGDKICLNPWQQESDMDDPPEPPVDQSQGVFAEPSG